ncbi:MAG: HPF/RaiA family ribosome-associated protein [Burkholderiales bacterium]
MQLPLQITFRHMARSDALEAAIREKADKLNEFYPRIMSCRVVVEEVAAHKHQGKLYGLHIDLKVPGHELAITRDRHEDIFVALRDAFDSAKRKLEEELRLQRGDVKVHEIPQHGRIARLDHEGGFGFIEAADGTELYFGRENVASPAFDLLVPGVEVRFLVEYAGEGPQAKRVSVGRHRFPSEA